jgi:hypothetical protein
VRRAKDGIPADTPDGVRLADLKKALAEDERFQ